MRFKHPSAAQAAVRALNGQLVRSMVGVGGWGGWRLKLFPVRRFWSEARC